MLHPGLSNRDEAMRSTVPPKLRRAPFIKGHAAPLIPAVTGRTRRGFAPALGGGKGAAGVQAACSARASRGGPLWVRCPHPVCPPHSFEQDEDTLYIPRPGGEVKGQFLLQCVKKCSAVCALYAACRRQSPAPDARRPAVLHKKHPPPRPQGRKTPNFGFMH